MHPRTEAETSAHGPELPAFLDHMNDALDAAQVGTHFEEGGCWGMALAMRDALAATGLDASLAIQDGHLHAMAAVGGRLVDHAGVMPSHVRATPVGPDVFRTAHEAAGWSVEEVDADRAMAADVIDVAREFSDATAPTPG